MISRALRRLAAEAAKPPTSSLDEKRHRLYVAGYAAGYQDALREAIEIAEEEEEE